MNRSAPTYLKAESTSMVSTGVCSASITFSATLRCGGRSTEHGAGCAALHALKSKTARTAFRSMDFLFLPQVPSRQSHKNVFEARLACRQVFEMRPQLVHLLEQRRNGEVRFLHMQADQSVVIVHRVHSRQRFPAIGLAILLARERELDHVMASQAFDQLRGAAFSNDLAVIY